MCGSAGTSTLSGMELIVMLLVPLPLGYLVRDRVAAYLAYVAVHSFVFTFQTMTLTRAWVGGETEAFGKDADAVPWSYAAVNAAIYAVGRAWSPSGRGCAAGAPPRGGRGWTSRAEEMFRGRRDQVKAD